MRRLVLLAVLVAGAILVGTASAAKPDHYSYSGTTSDSDFCGTGQTVDIAYAGVETDFSNGKTTGQETDVYTNPVNGSSVVVTSSGQVDVQLVNDADGGYTYVVSYRGAQEKIKAGGHGPLLTHDAGYLTFYDHYDADGNYLGTDVVEHGQHPEANSDFTLFCSVVPNALGLS